MCKPLHACLLCGPKLALRIIERGFTFHFFMTMEARHGNCGSTHACIKFRFSQPQQLADTWLCGFCSYRSRRINILSIWLARTGSVAVGWAVNENCDWPTVNPAVEPVQDGRTYIELINGPFLYRGGPARRPNTVPA
jgi:hypothetical protein